LGNLIDVANHEHNQLVWLEVFLSNSLHVLSGNRTNPIAVSGPVVSRTFRVLVLSKGAGYLRRGGEDTREEFDDRVFGGLEFFRCYLDRSHAVNLFQDDVDGCGRGAIFG